MSSEGWGSASPSEADAMRRALELALGGWGRVAPNPLVGAVVLQHGTVVGEGYHAEYGGEHPQGGALKAAGGAAPGAALGGALQARALPSPTPPPAPALLSAGATPA